MTGIYAAADIGSNTAHLLVGATNGQLVMRIDNYNEWIQLGEVVARHGEVPKEQTQQLVSAVKEFKRICKDKQCQSLYIFATEGLRAASNHDHVLKKISSETGIKVEIITPRREAELSLGGIILDSRNLAPDLLFEVGGGSVQIGKIVNDQITEEESLPLGTGRLIAEGEISYPCSELSLRKVRTYLEHWLSRATLIERAEIAVVSGGVARGLWRALHPDGEKMLTREEIDYMVWSSARLPLDRIINRFSVKTRRASTLLPGALVYQALMEKFSLKSIIVSEFGIREGAILQMASGLIEGNRI